nr:hypothetical protein [Maliibacterium massiliense]
MTLRASYQYRLRDSRTSVLVFYIVMVALWALTFITSALSLKNGIHANGMEIASAIFLFVLGLNSHKESFNLLLQNGVSRKTQFVSFCMSIATLAAVMALIDTLIGQLVIHFLPGSTTLFMQTYALHYAGGATLGAALDAFIWAFFLYGAFGMLGYVITSLYYRMSAAVKTLVSVGVPVLLFIVLPIADVNLTGGQIFAWIARSIMFCLGITNMNPYICVLFSLIAFAVLGGVAFLLNRRAVIKAR